MTESQILTYNERIKAFSNFLFNLSRCADRRSRGTGVGLDRSRSHCAGLAERVRDPAVYRIPTIVSA